MKRLIRKTIEAMKSTNFDKPTGINLYCRIATFYFYDILWRLAVSKYLQLCINLCYYYMS